MKKVLKGEIYYADLDPVVGSEEGGLRPVLIIQSNRGTKNCPTCVVAPLTKLINKTYKLSTHVYINPRNYLKYDSVILLEHTRSISKDRLKQFVARITDKEQELVNQAILNTFNIRKGDLKYERKNLYGKNKND